MDVAKKQPATLSHDEGRVETHPESRVAALAHAGPYDTIGAAFDRLGAIAGRPAALGGRCLGGGGGRNPRAAAGTASAGRPAGCG